MGYQHSSGQPPYPQQMGAGYPGNQYQMNQHNQMMQGTRTQENYYNPNIYGPTSQNHRAGVSHSIQYEDMTPPAHGSATYSGGFSNAS
jgi:hypothetical protein